MATIASQKSALEKWAPLIIFDVILKDATPRYWAKQAVTFAGHNYLALVLDHSEMRLEGNGVYGVDAVAQIGLTLNNADGNLNSLITPANWQGGVIQPRFIFVAPDGTTTTDAIVYPKFLADLPTSTWPRIEFSAHNKWNLARKMLPLSLVTKKDRYPFPDTAAERTAAGSDPTSPFYAIGYDPATGKGLYKTGSTPYTPAEYDGTREKLKAMGLEVRYGGFGKVPPTIVATPKKGEVASYVGNANDGKYGQAVPLVFGTCRIQPIVLDTGFPTGWHGSRLSHFLLSDGVTFAPSEGLMGIEACLDVFIPDNAKFQRIPATSNQPEVFGAWSLQGGYYGSQKAPATSKYRNIDQATDFGADPAADFPARDLYSGLAYLEIGFPKELSGEDGLGPKVEAIVKGLKIETWDSGGTSTWQWTDNPVWVFVHLLKLLRWSTTDLDKPTIAAAAAYCDEVIGSGKKRFRCNLPLMAQTRANDLLRGIRNNCRMYTSFANDGKLQLRIAQNTAGEGGLAFTLDTTTIMRGDDGQLMVEKFHRSIFETANVFSCTFQNEDNLYNADSVTMIDVPNVNQIDERVPADSIFPMLGIPSFDQAERQLEWARQEQVTLNEYYRVTASFALIDAKVGQIGTITEPRHGLVSQAVRIRAMAPGPDAGTVELVIQKHSDGAYTDQSVSTPFTRAQADSSYTPRSVGGKNAASPAPVLTEVIVAGPTGTATRRIRVEFKPPSQTFEGVFSRETNIRDVVVATSGGTIPGGQVLFVEVAPIKAGVRGLASEYLMAVIPSGGNLNKITLTCELPPEADQYVLFVGNFPGQTYEQTVATSPGTAPFTITVSNLTRNFGSIPPDPAFDHVSVFYRYNSSPNVLRDGGRTFSPTETTLEFEPELPAGNDTQVTVYVSSANAAEDDWYPIEVSPKATLTLTQETGKPMGWTATLLPGPTPSSVIPKFTRPTTNGKRLFWVSGVIKDTSTGVWRDLDENAGASVVYYDGSGISHESVAGKIKKDPGVALGFGTAHIDDLIMLDVAGATFDRDRCQWGTVADFQDDLGFTCAAGVARYVVVNGLFRPQTTQDLRMKIVKPHWTWTSEGYIGATGCFYEDVIGKEGNEFILPPVEIGMELSSADVRFWIENDYCRSSGGGIVSTNHVAIHAARDNVLPGAPQTFVVNPVGPEFRGTWKTPLTGAATLIDAAVQYATDAGFTAPITAGGLGPVYHAEGYDPGKTYWFRVAMRNQSGLTSHTDTTILGTLGWGTTGWGPWSAVVGPRTSSASTGPVDTVLPGTVVGLSVTGGKGKFIAEWSDPATGNLTIDDVAISWSINSSFVPEADNSPTQGWGKRNTLDSESPNCIFWFRLAVHNQSGLPSHASTIALGPTGWGEWVSFGSAVPSGTATGAGWQSPGENLCPNPSFELDADNDGLPDDCTYPMTGTPAAGSGRIAPGAHGSYAFQIRSGNSSVALGGFAVFAGDRLSMSCRVAASAPSAVGGFYFRASFHGTTRQFTGAPPQYVDIVSNTVVPGGVGYTQYEGQVTVPANMGWCRVELFNYGGTGVDYYFDDVVVTRTANANDIQDNTIPPAKFTGAARTTFAETFDTPLSSDGWTFAGTAYSSYGVLYPQSGVDGGNVLHANGGLNANGSKILIPYDPRKLYRLTVRARLMGTPTDPAKTKVYFGVTCMDAAKASLGAVYMTANALDAYPSWPVLAWQELSGWFKGTGGTYIQPAPDSQNPTPLPAGTAYINPQFLLNWSTFGDAPIGNQMQIDDYRIEIFDEATYISPAPNGTFASPTRWVTYPWQSEAGAATVALFWDYTDGLVKAQQFAITIDDGAAQWVERVRARAGIGALRHSFTIYRLSNTRAVTISIVAEAIRPGGQVPGPTTTWGTFTTNANFGGDPGGGWVSVGQIDWAQGNIWFDSYQYRNNIPPDNAPGGSLSITRYSSGSGADRIIITGFSYTQGANIATHLAVYLKAPNGSINLYSDMVVARISATSLPSSFEIPISLDNNQSYAIAVVAIALCKAGPIPKTTYPVPTTKPQTEISVQCVNYPYQVMLGQQSTATENIFAWRPLRVEQPANVEFWTGTNAAGAGGTKRGRVGADATGLWLVNGGDTGVIISPPGAGGAASVGIGTTAFGGSGNMLVFGPAPAVLTPVSGNGYLYQQSGAGHWMSGAGTHTTFAPAGPHCAKCGYDFWMVAMDNKKWGASLHICGMCGARYQKGPETVLHLLTDQEKGEIIK